MSALFDLVGERFLPTDLSRGPWSPHALHGGPPAALLARSIERSEGGGSMHVARLTVELLKPVPLEPLSLEVRMVRPGRKVQLVEATLRTEAHEVARALALRIRRIDLPIPDDLPHDGEVVEPPERGHALEMSANFYDGFHSRAVEHRFVRGSFKEAGASTDWIRLKVPLIAGEETSPLCRVAAVADFGNGISGVLPPDRFTYINPDLTVSLHRYPRDEWVCLDARTRVEPNGIGMAESRLFDRDGPIGRAVQCLILDHRPRE
jgi:hypothetical protein